MTPASMRFIRYAFWLSALTLPSLLEAQLDPMGVQVFSYFPQIADGGGSAQKWTTSFTFTNPHPSYTANATLYFYGDNGQPLTLNVGNGAVARFDFTLGPASTVTFTSTAASSTVQTGWAIATCSLPLQSVAQYRYSVNGVAQQGVSVPATPASVQFLSPATGSSGIALANPSNGNVPLSITVTNEHGTALQHFNMNLAPLAHAAFNLYQIFPSLGAGFRGSVSISTQPGEPFFVALILSGDGGVLSSYPPAGLTWPVSQYERIWKIWSKVLNQAVNLPQAGLTSVPGLVIDPNTQQINSYACAWTWSTPTLSCTASDLNKVHIFLNIAELMSDSDGELAFIIAHELGHIIQGHGTGRPDSYLAFIPQDREWDADTWGLFLSIGAGYDPYSGTGALGRLYTAGNNLLAPNFDGIGDPHGSLLQRLTVILTDLELVCSQAPATCAQFKAAFHPHFPGSVLLEEHGLKLEPPSASR